MLPAGKMRLRREPNEARIRPNEAINEPKAYYIKNTNISGMSGKVRIFMACQMDLCRPKARNPAS